MLLLETYPYSALQIHQRLPQLRRGRREPQVEIHPDTAKQHGIQRGDWVLISTPRGSIRQRASLTEDMHPGVIGCQHGRRFPEREGWEHGIWESNANILTSQSGPYDPAMGLSTARDAVPDRCGEAGGGVTFS